MANTTVVTADYGTVITAVGSAKIAACILNGTKLNITHAAVGDGGGAYYKPTPEQEKLKSECWRGEIVSYELNKTNANMIDVTFIVPAEVGGFTIREGALIDADGDTIAICNTPDAQKVPITNGVSFPLTMIMHIIVTDASVVQVTVNPTLDTVSRKELEEALAKQAAGVGSAIIVSIAVPVSAWTAVGEGMGDFGKYLYTADVKVAECLDKHFPAMALTIPSLEIATSAGLCPTIETLDGSVRFWAEAIPTADLSGTICLRSENLLHEGGDVATDEEVKDAVDDVLGDSTTSGGNGGNEGSNPDDTSPGLGNVEIATDEMVAETVQGIFGV